MMYFVARNSLLLLHFMKEQIVKEEMSSLSEWQVFPSRKYSFVIFIKEDLPPPHTHPNFLFILSCFKNIQFWVIL